MGLLELAGGEDVLALEEVGALGGITIHTSLNMNVKYRNFNIKRKIWGEGVDTEGA